MRRLVKLFMIATIAMMAARMGYAQTVSVPNPLPNTAWPMDSVVRGMVKKFTVTGDQIYDKPSTFIWNVKGGRIFLDADTLVAAPAPFNTDTLKGNSLNKSSIWVVWDKFEQPLDTGYVYAYEISDDGCQRDASDQSKYVGRRVKVSAPPKAWFISNETLVCNDENEISVVLKVTGMPPYDITYTLNGATKTLNLELEDMVDLDLDGQLEEYAFVHTGFAGTTTDQVFNYKLIEASSGGVIGTIAELQGYANHNLLVHPIPVTPEILVDWVEVSQGTTHKYFMQNDTNTVSRYWELVDSDGNVVFEANSTTASENWMDVPFNVDPGRYTLNAWYYDQNDLNIEGCESGTAQLTIDVFAPPTIGFADAQDITTCSAVSLVPTEKLDFVVEYQGARPFWFDLVLRDYDGKEIRREKFEQQTDNVINFSFDNILINDELPEEDRTWTLEIEGPYNNETGTMEVTIEEGKGVRKIIIHPKPFIDGLIDFEN